MRKVVYTVIGLVIGFAITLLFYWIGEPVVLPSLFLARLISADSGGDSLLPAFMIINTLIWAIVIYLLLWSVNKYRR